MSYKQQVTPNFDPVIKQGATILNDWLGWCEAYLEQSVGVFYAFNTAYDNWTKAKGKHTGDYPKNVWIPLYYSGYKGMGHVLWAKINNDGSGTAYTAPNSHKPYADKLTFKNLTDLTNQLHRGWSADLKLLGWSEYVGNKQIVKYAADSKPPTPSKPILKSKKGTATVLVNALNVRDSPDAKKGRVVATYNKGEKFNYDGYIITNGYVWLSYISKSRERRYVAEGPYDNNSKNVWVKGGIS